MVHIQTDCQRFVRRKINMSTETDNKIAASSVAGKQSVSIAEYNQLLSRTSLMERKLKAMENLQDLLRQKDLELMKCRNAIQIYQTALHKYEDRRMDYVHTIAKICDINDTHGNEKTYEVENELDQNKGLCLPYANVTGGKLQKLVGMTVSSDVADGSTVLAQPSSVSIVSAASPYIDSNCSKTSSAGYLISEGRLTERKDSSEEKIAMKPETLQHETGTSFTEDLCGRITNLQDEKKMEIVSGSTGLKSNQDRTGQRKALQSPHNVPSMSKDLLIKLMQQNARLKKALKDILVCKGTSVEHYLDTQELKDTVVQLRQRLAESSKQMTGLHKKIKTLSQCGTPTSSEFEVFITVDSKHKEESNKGGTELSEFSTRKFPSGTSISRILV